MRHFFALALLALSSTALAQPAADAPTEQPALMGIVEDEAPAVITTPAAQTKAPAAAPQKRQEEGTTIVGERESPIGLFITPWRNAFAEEDIDRPARLLQEELMPIDEAVFVRQIEYYEALSGALKGKNAVTPPVLLGPDAP